MTYTIVEKGNQVIIEAIEDFIPKHIFECGQCFRWHSEEDGSYTGVAFGKVINIKKEDKRVILSNTNINDFRDIWYNYFDLDRYYGDIKRKLAQDPVLKKAIQFGEGIRILNQDPWETLVSFIVSTNRGIPIIKKSIEAMSEAYGDFIEVYKGRKYYSFPEPDKLAYLTDEEIKACYTGYRGRYITDSAIIVNTGQPDIHRMKNLPTEMARKELMVFPGVGPKVADCVMLFSMNKSDAFPIDVWVKRVMSYFYLKEEGSLKEIQDYAQEKFGELAGFAQQYLFYYARELGVGKTRQ